MTDVVIFGGGPAGLAASIILKEGGLEVIIVDRANTKMKSTGESLAGSARHSLAKLGVWEVFLKDRHQPCYANSSAWGSDELEQYSFVQSVDGHGWHIDRQIFDTRLVERAILLGVDIIKSNHHKVSQSLNGSWLITSDQMQSPIQANIIVDASGRSSWVARQMDIDRLKQDDQVGLVAFLNSDKSTPPDDTSLVESVENGWWYSALQPDGRLACVFFSDHDLHEGRSSTIADNWNHLLAQSKFTKARVKGRNFKLESKPFFRSANSSVLKHPFGNRWMAVGDAAMSYDPLSSHGLSLALASGIDAAEAIKGQLDSQPLLLQQYAMKLQEAFIHYTEERFKYYLQEQRWRHAPYWKRRHSKEKHFEFLEKYLDGVIAH